MVLLADPPQVAIVSGGRGTRLRPLTDTVPKPIVPVAGEPFLAHVLRFLSRHGVGRAVLCTGYRAMQIERAIGDGTRFGLKVVYSQEARPLGVIGALRHAAPLLDDGFILQYGDALPELPTTLFARQARQRAEPSAMAVTAARHGRGNVEVSSRRVVRYDKTALLPWMDYGMLAFEKSLLFDYPSSTEGDLFPRLAAAGLTAAIETCLPVHTVDDERAYRAFERLVLSQPSRFSSPRSDSMRSATRRSEQG